MSTHPRAPALKGLLPSTQFAGQPRTDRDRKASLPDVSADPARQQDVSSTHTIYDQYTRRSFIATASSSSRSPNGACHAESLSVVRYPWSPQYTLRCSTAFSFRININRSPISLLCFKPFPSRLHVDHITAVPLISIHLHLSHVVPVQVPAWARIPVRALSNVPVDDPLRYL